MIRKGMEKGREEGMEKGMEKGIEKGQILIAKRLISQGSNIKFIASITGLSESVILSLQSKS